MTPTNRAGAKSGARHGREERTVEG